MQRIGKTQTRLAALVRVRMLAKTLAVVFLTMVTMFGFTSPANASGTGRIAASPCLNFRSSPGGALIGCVPLNTSIVVQCVANGPAVTGPWGTESIWDKYTWNGMTGYSADAWIMTGSNTAVAPPCSTSGSASIDTFKAWALNSGSWNSYTPSGYRGIDADGYYGAQCADLGIAWSARVGRRVPFDGYDGSGVYKSGWYAITGTLASARPGDVVTRVAGWRHVVVVVGNPVNGTVSVVQQNPKSPAVAYYSTGTTGVIWRMR